MLRDALRALARLPRPIAARGGRAVRASSQRVRDRQRELRAAHRPRAPLTRHRRRRLAARRRRRAPLGRRAAVGALHESAARRRRRHLRGALRVGARATDARARPTSTQRARATPRPSLAPSRAVVLLGELHRVAGGQAAPDVRSHRPNPGRCQPPLLFRTSPATAPVPDIADSAESWVA